MILIGNGVGFLFALVAFTISVVAFPLLIDRKVGAAAAAADLGQGGAAQSADDGAVGPDRRRGTAASDRCRSSSVWRSCCRCSAMRPGTCTARWWCRTCRRARPSHAPKGDATLRIFPRYCSRSTTRRRRS